MVSPPLSVGPGEPWSESEKARCVPRQSSCFWGTTSKLRSNGGRRVVCV